MSADFNKPSITDNYSSGYTPAIVDNMRALAQWLDPALVTPANLPASARGWSSANKRWEVWNGSSWANGEPGGGYAINISGNAATATTAAACSGNAATATTAAACSGNAATATTAAACSGNAATATSAGSASTSTTAAEGTATTAIATTEFVDRQRDVIAVPKSGTYTLALTDRGKSVDTSAGVTVPANATVGFQVGATVTITNTSASSITITQASGVTLRQAGTTNTGNRTLANYGVATLRKIATDTWIISGAGLS